MADENEIVVRYKDQAYQVETQTPGITEESIADADRRIGMDWRSSRVTIEITRDNINDFCNYMGSSNPLFLDEEYARKTRWGGFIAPPAMVGTAIIAPGMRGVQWIYAGTEWEFFQVMRPGDIIVMRGRYLGGVQKKGAAVSQWYMQKGETICTNQRGELVARAQVYCARTPRRQAEGGMQYEARNRAWSADELESIEKAMLNEGVRGSELRYWEDVVVGEEIRSVAYGPLRAVDIALTGSFTDTGVYSAEGEAHAGGHVYQLIHRRRHPADTYVDPVTGIQDHPHRGHWESFMAQEVGMPGVYDVGPHRVSWLCRFITDWMGDDAFLKKLSGWLRRPNVVSDVTYMKGTVEEKWVENGETLVRCQLLGINQEEQVTMPGSAVVRLPSRSV
ncbi:MAG: MaoC family dehydratase N-terminal domain-containing protein [Dehalococcoidia bacterium]|nr:MaoC family dehydratase N-terminal domain-containing protein [Dehalococcoidia bacterium]